MRQLLRLTSSAGSLSLRCVAFIRRWYRDLGANNAEQRGIKLLQQWLTPAQLAQYEMRNFFDVTGCDSGRRYRIRHGKQVNVCELDGNGRTKTGWCFVPDGQLVPGDVMLAQKIALETNERSALGAAKQFNPFWD